MRPRGGAVAVLAVLGLVMALPASGEAGGQVRNGLIAFARGGGVYVLNPATDRTHRITDRAGSGLFYNDVAWSPDGRRIAVTTEHALLTMNARGGQLRVVAWFSRQAFLSSVAWSPDGQELAVSDGFGSQRSEIVLLRFRDHRCRRVASSFRVFYYALSWTPDGRRIVYAESPHDGDDSVHSMRADGSDRRTISPGGEPRLSRDGTRIAFNLGNGVRVMRADGSRSHVVKRDQRLVSYGIRAWSPDGKWLLLDRMDRRPIPRPRSVADLVIVGADGLKSRHVGPFFRGSFTASLGAAWAPAH
jgi:Tol biopolymer transport system component